jgi:class I fructose-bisphosphate aldolase/fructose-bisphosphate aldolase/2-amino-3,7-dideoxy-D-threo-hept-6-ulosonate synthase
MGPIDGIKSLDQINKWIGHPSLSGIIAHKGIVQRLGERGMLDHLGVMVHLNGMSSFSADPDTKEMVTSVQAAQRLGADAVSIQLNFNGSNEAHNMQLLGRVADAAHEAGLPLLTMLYDKVTHADDQARITRLRHLIRLTIELGADALKLAPPSASRVTWELPQILSDHAEDTAIYFAGGALCDDSDLFRLARESVNRGGAGLCVGRNIFGKAKVSQFLFELERAMHSPSLNQRRFAENQVVPVY